MNSHSVNARYKARKEFWNDLKSEHKPGRKRPYGRVIIVILFQYPPNTLGSNGLIVCRTINSMSYQTWRAYAQKGTEEKRW